MADDIQYIGTEEASKRAEVVPETILNWCNHYSVAGGYNKKLGIGSVSTGLGFKMRGRWKIDPSKLQLIIEGKEMELWNLLEEEIKMKVRDLYEKEKVTKKPDKGKDKK